MENSQSSLATESFSYSWLVNPTPTGASIDFPPLLTNNFSFDDHFTSLPLVHADKLFSNGLLMPVFDTPNSQHTNNNNYASTISTSTSSSNPSSSSTFSTSVSASLSRHQQSVFPRKFSRFSRKFLHKYLGFLVPSCPRRRSQRVDDLDRRAQEMKSLSTTPEAVSPRISSTWSDYADSSIYEAILYCKRSSATNNDLIFAAV